VAVSFGGGKAVMIDVDKLAQEIRRVDGNHDKGAGALSEALMPFITAALSHADYGGVKVKALEWKRSGWVEAFSKPGGLGFWYSIQPHKPVHGHGDPPFTCFVTWGEPGQNSREYLGEDFQSVEEAKAAAQADYEARILSALTQAPAPTLTGEVETPAPVALVATPADQIISQIETLFPNWRSYRDLIDCIECTLHDFRKDAGREA